LTATLFKIKQFRNINAMHTTRTTLLPSKNLGLVMIWFLAIGGLLLISSNLENKSSQFFGTAGSQEQLISFQYPVEIVQVPVVEGQEVVMGDNLLEVRRSDLASRQAIIQDQIMELQIREREAIATTIAQLESMRAEQQSKVVEIDTQINSLESRYFLNQRLVQDVTGDESRSAGAGQASQDVIIANDGASPMAAEITGLTEAKRHIQNSYQIQIDNLQEQLDVEMRPAIAQIAELQERQSDLQRQQADLSVSAQFSGQIGSVLHKPGEQVAPFSPVMTVHGSAISFVKGYIHEDVINDVAPGGKVWIRSQRASRDNLLYEGFVESIGSRIVEFPERLRSNTMVTTWGREVIVFVSQDTPLLLGEKVSVFLEKPGSTLDSMRSLLAGVARFIGNGQADSH